MLRPYRGRYTHTMAQATGLAAALTPGVNAQTLSLSFREVSMLLRAGIPVDDALEQSSSFGP